MSDILLKKGSYALMDKATIALVGFIYVILSARALSRVEYGALMLAMSIFNFLILYSDSGTGNALIKYSAEGRERNLVLGSALRIKMISALIVSAISLIFAFILPPVFYTPQLFHIFLFLPVLIFTMVLNTFFKQGLQAEHRIREIFFTDLIGLIFICALFLFGSYFGVLNSALSVLLMLSLSNLASAIYGLRVSGYGIPMERDKGWSGKIFDFSKYTTISSLGSMLYTRTDMVMLGLILGATGVAVYSSAWVLASAVYLIPQAMYMVVFPMASKMSTENRKSDMWRLYWKGVAYSLALSIPASLILILFPEQILSLVYSGKYMESAYVLQVLALWGIIRPFGNLAGAFIDGMGSPEINAKLVWTTAAINVVANAAMIPYFGVVGAAYASILAFMVGAPLGVLYIRSKLKGGGA